MKVPGPGGWEGGVVGGGSRASSPGPGTPSPPPPPLPASSPGPGTPNPPPSTASSPDPGTPNPPPPNPPPPLLAWHTHPPRTPSLPHDRYKTVVTVITVTTVIITVTTVLGHDKGEPEMVHSVVPAAKLLRTQVGRAAPPLHDGPRHRRPAQRARARQPRSMRHPPTPTLTPRAPPTTTQALETFLPLTPRNPNVCLRPGGRGRVRSHSRHARPRGAHTSGAVAPLRLVSGAPYARRRGQGRRAPQLDTARLVQHEQDKGRSLPAQSRRTRSRRRRG